MSMFELLFGYYPPLKYSKRWFGIECALELESEINLKPNAH